MLERIAAALELDTPELFSAAPIPPEAITEFHEGIKADIEARLENLMRLKKG